MTATKADGARRYASQFSERERAIREVAFEAGAEWADESDDRFPAELPADIPATACHRTNPCPGRPRHFLGRYTDRPWRCPQCGRWWVTEHRSSYATQDSGGFYVWVRAEEGNRQ